MRSLPMLFIAALCQLGGAAQAATLPNSSLLGNVGLSVAGNLTSTNFTEFGRFGIPKGPFGLIGFDSGGKPSPFMEAVVDIGPSIDAPLISGSSSGVLNYYLEILSPVSLTLGVAIDVAGSVFGSASAASFDATYSMESSWALFDSPTSGVQLASDIIRTNLKTGSYEEQYGRTVVVNMETNRVYRVLLVANARADVRPGHSVEAVARIDPVFSFEPGVDLSLVSFNFSEGIGNSPVPVPTSIALLATAVLGLAPFRRRRQLVQPS